MTAPLTTAPGDGGEVDLLLETFALDHVEPVPQSLRRSRLRPLDLVAEAVLSLRATALRSALVSLGTVVASAALIATFGVSQTISHQVSNAFDVRRATEVSVRPAPGRSAGGWSDVEALDRLRGLAGVVEAGPIVDRGAALLTRPPDTSPREVPLHEVDSHTLALVRPRVVIGRAFDAFHVRNQSPVVLLPLSVASRLGVSRPGTVVEVAGRRRSVIGIFDDVDRREELLLSALVPLSPASATSSVGDGTTVVVATAPGAAAAVARQAPVALRPQDPTALVAVSPPESVTLRRSVESGVTSLALGAALISLVLGTISIASATTSSVHSRTGEIGLRAVLGARRRHVFGQILLETGLLGLAGAVAGSVIGLTIVIATATWNGWVPVVDPRFTALAIGGGGLSGLLAGVGPAIRAMRLQPVDALRR